MNQEKTNGQANRFWFPVKALGVCVCGCGGWVEGALGPRYSGL